MATSIVARQDLFVPMHERAFQRAIQLLADFPGEYFSVPLGRVTSARDLAIALIRRERLMRDASGGLEHAVAMPLPATREQILLAYEDAHHKCRESLARLSDADWNAELQAPQQPDVLDPVRRGDLLWVSLEVMLNEVERLAQYRDTATRLAHRMHSSEKTA